MRSGQTDKVGAARQQDRVHLIGLGDIANRHCGQPRFVSDPVAERGLEHSAIDGPRFGRCLARRHVNDIGPRRRKHPGNFDRIRRRHTIIANPVIGRDTHRHRLLCGPGGTHGAEHFQRIAHPVLQAAATVIRAGV